MRCENIIYNHINVAKLSQKTKFLKCIYEYEKVR